MRSSLEFLRFIFICIIAIWHDTTINVIFSHSVVVEFFFILSGFLLYKTFIRHSAPPLIYVKSRIKRLYCEYFVALIIAIIINVIREPTCIRELIGYLIPELFMIQSIGIFNGGINPINWYIQVMLVSSFFLYSLLYCNSQLAKNVLIPMLALGGLTYLFAIGDSVVRWETIGCIYSPLLRGLSCMSIGVLSAWIFMESNNTSHWKHLFINMFSIVAIVLIFVAIRIQDPLDKYVIFLSPFIIIACFEDKSWLNLVFHAKWQLYLGRISYAMLLIHCAYIPVFHKMISVVNTGLSVKIPFSLTIFLYLLILVLLSAMFQKLCDFIRQYALNYK